jgi:histidinol-phosphate aminotransferase
MNPNDLAMSGTSTSPAMHGGPDAAGVPRWDFSTNANPCGPAPMVLRAVQDADPTRYPDPSYHALREALAALHGVAPARIVIAASASEFIQRLTQAVARHAPHSSVRAPEPGYADYRRAAEAWGLPLRAAGDARLVWHTEPASPLGSSRRAPPVRDDALLVIDAAYEPLRLEGEAPPMPSHAWCLHSPNKALGLTGVRAAYAVAPQGAEAWCERLQQLAPSWPLGAHGVAMLQAWARDDTQAWVQACHRTLREWKQRQVECLAALGWACEPSVTNFFVARCARADVVEVLRPHGIKLRETSTMGLPGALRLSVQPPAAQDALMAAWQILESGAA